MTRITRSKRTKFDFSSLTQNLPVATVTTGTTSRAPNVQTRRSSAQASRQEEGTILKAKLNSVWLVTVSHKDNRNRIYSKLFMTLPDKKRYPDYYEEIKNPISLDVMKRKIDDEEYFDEEEFVADIDLMCENAKKYNVEGSQIHNDAIILQKLARKLLKGDTEKDQDKDDNDFSEISTNIDEVEHNGEIYHVGDYVHIANEVDASKPNVAHIHRIWENSRGVKGIYVCWYYRPEQTKHQATHKFYENEVFKTNTFHDHSFDDVIEKCFVLQYKDYISGRPKGSEGKPVYLCESRYNEHQKNFSKIKNWASTMPDGISVRKVDLVKFKAVVIPKKVESALAASLRKTMEKTKTEESRKEIQIQARYEHDVDSHTEDVFSSSPRAITPIRSAVRLGRPPRSQGTNKRQTPVAYQHPQPYQPTYDSDHYTSYASSSVVHSPYSMSSGYPITSTPLTENVQNTGMPHQYEFVASPHEMPISMPPIPPQHQFMPQQYYHAPVVQQTTPVMPNPHPTITHPHPAMTHPTMQHSAMTHSTMPHPVMPHSVMQSSVMQSSVMQSSVMQNSIMQSSVMQNSVMQNMSTMQNIQSYNIQNSVMQNMQNPAIQNPKPTINHRSGSMLEVSSETAEYFARDDEGNVLWFSSAPVNVVPLLEPMHSLDYLHRREEIVVRENDKKRKFEETSIESNNQDTIITESQNQPSENQPAPQLKELDLVNGIEELGNRWKNDANLIVQQLNESRPEYYEEK